MEGRGHERWKAIEKELQNKNHWHNVHEMSTHLIPGSNSS